jgi:hypothetical protein
MRNTRRRRERKKNRKECEHTSGPGSHKSVSNDDAMLMNSSIVDDNFLCVLFFLPHTIDGDWLRRHHNVCLSIIIILVMRTIVVIFFLKKKEEERKEKKSK